MERHTVTRPAGLIIIDDPELGRAIEHDTKQCVHCGMHWRHQPGSGRIRGFCMKCSGPICGPNCLECIPIERQIEILEGANPSRVSVGGKLWIR